MSAFADEFPRIGILNDYVHIPFANGSSFASQFLYREFSRLGSEVTVIGPEDPAIVPSELPPRNVLTSSLPLRNHPGVRIPMPSRSVLRELTRQEFSITVAQTCTGLMAKGLWLRRAHGVPFVAVNTVHMPAVYDVMLPDALRSPQVEDFFQRRIVPRAQSLLVDYYNGGDGLVVLSSGLKKYWQDLGVHVPIHVVPRSVDPEVFDRPATQDPYPSWARRGDRLLVVCRHTREKGIIRLLDLFAKHILPQRPNASLALVGDGPDHEVFQAHAKRLKVFDRCIWPGEVGLEDVPNWYQNSDLFVYPSLSETYGQVVSEALWTGLPVVAFDDDKGVSDQVTHGGDGFLVRPEAADADGTFGARVDQLLDNEGLRRSFSICGKANARHRSDPERCVATYQDVFRFARQHRDEYWQPSGSWERAAPLVRMGLWHSMAALLGLVRQPAELNRNGQKQPAWDRQDQLPQVSAAARRGAPASTPPAAPARVVSAA